VVLTARVMVGGGGAGKDRRLGLLTSTCAHISAAYAELVLLRWYQCHVHRAVPSYPAIGHTIRGSGPLPRGNNNRDGRCFLYNERGFERKNNRRRLYTNAWEELAGGC